MSMKIERSSLDQVKARFEMNKKKKEEKIRDYDFEERVKELAEEVHYMDALLYSVLLLEDNLNRMGGFELFQCF